MGSFLNRLMNNINVERNDEDPLFGGLIPRRIDDRQQLSQPQGNTTQQPVMQPSGMNTPIRQTGMNRVNDAMIYGGQADSNQGKDYVFDWSRQKLDLEKDKQGLDREKFSFDKDKNAQRYGLDVREQDRKELDDRNTLGIDKEKLNLEKDKVEIDHRKAALDEWKARNPAGDIQIAKDGKIFVVNKTNGTSIDTGLHSEHLSEAEKLKLGAKNASDLETQRQKGRMELEANKDKTKNISPTAQRAAEKDAASELLNDPNYAWLNGKGIVTIATDGRVVIDRSKMSGSATDKTNGEVILKKFESEWKGKAHDRMNKTFDSTSKDSNINSDTVEMIDGKTGEKLSVPKSEVETARTHGAILPGESKVDEVKKDTPKPLQVDDSIELLYNDAGKVVGARNKKAVK